MYRLLAAHEQNGWPFDPKHEHPAGTQLTAGAQRPAGFSRAFGDCATVIARFANALVEVLLFMVQRWFPPGHGRVGAVQSRMQPDQEWPLRWQLGAQCEA